MGLLGRRRQHTWRSSCSVLVALPVAASIAGDSQCTASDTMAHMAPDGVCVKWAGKSLTAACSKCLVGDKWASLIAELNPGRVVQDFIPVLEMDNWDGHRLQVSILRIILEEVLGFTANVLYREDPATGVMPRLDSGCASFNPEVWGARESKNENYTRFVLQRGSITSFEMGTYGAETLYLAGDNVGFMAHYQAMQKTHRCSTVALDAFPRDGTTNVSQLQAGNNGTLKCGDGDRFFPRSTCKNGRWYPPQCLPLGSNGYSPHCYEMYVPNPGWGEGWYESVIYNLQLNFSVVYLGNNPSNFHRYCATRDAVLFWWWEPSPLIAGCQAFPIHLPKYTQACRATYNKEPLESGVNCSQPRESLYKMMHKAAKDRNIFLSTLFDRYLFTNKMQLEALGVLTAAGGNHSVEKAACNWVKDNVDMWRKWIHKPQAVSSTSSGPDTVLVVVICLVIVVLLLCLICVSSRWYIERRKLVSKIGVLLEEYSKRQLPDVDTATEFDRLLTQAEDAAAVVLAGSSWPCNRTQRAQKRQSEQDLRNALLTLRSAPKDKLFLNDFKKELQRHGLDAETTAALADIMLLPKSLQRELDEDGSFGQRRINASQRSEIQHYGSLVFDLKGTVRFEEICDWTTFDIFRTANRIPRNLLFIGLFHAVADRGLDAVEPLQISRDALAIALQDAQLRYEQPQKGNERNTYHIALHGVDVMCTAAAMLKWLPSAKAGLKTTPLISFSVVIAALFHDFCHPGVNSKFLSAIHDCLAIQFSDDSVLERMHLAETFRLLRMTGCTESMAEPQYQTFRKLVIQMILATDLARGFANVAAVKALFPAKFTTLTAGRAVTAPIALPGYAPGPDAEDDSEEANQELLHAMLPFLVECADISHPVKRVNVHKAWSVLMAQEFLAQGELEISHGIPISPMCIREAIEEPARFRKGQQGFIDFVVAPKIRVLSTIFDKDDLLVKQLMDNHALWGPEEQHGFASIFEMLQKDGTFIDIGIALEKSESFLVEKSESLCTQETKPLVT